MVVVSNRPRWKELCRERAIPPEIIDHTLADFIASLNDEKAPGRFHPSETRRAFRHGKNGNVPAISGGGIRYRADGGAAEYDWRDEPDTWTSKVTETDREVSGNPLHPEGRALGKEVRLAKDEWTEVPGEGDPMLAIHIPGGGELRPIGGACFLLKEDFNWGGEVYLRQDIV